MDQARYPQRDRLEGCLPQRRVLGRKLPEEMAVIFLAQRLPQSTEHGARASPHIDRLNPGPIADLPDEIERSYRMRLRAAALGRLEFRRQRGRKIDGEVLDLSLA